MSGFVYKVRVHGTLLIKKEIPGPDTVDEFLYEINALNQLTHAKDVIQFYGVVVDDREEHVTGLLISYASRGALIDVIYDNHHSLPWPTREKWARQIVGGLSEIHEAGFVQGDFTLSNIVIDENDDAKIIDINRRGCPIGWEPPEATPLVDSNQRISMYIGVKSDLYQLGMVLWALATQEDEPDSYGRPLEIDPDVQVPSWYRRVVDTCLSANPRDRVQAVQLLSWFPDSEEGSHYASPSGHSVPPSGDGIPRHDYLSPADIPRIKPTHPPSDWAHVGWGSHVAEEPFYYPSRGRSPPSPMPSNQGDYNGPRYGHRMYTWSDSFNHAPPVPSVSDVLARDARGESMPRLQGSEETLETYADGPYRFRGTVTDTSRDDESYAERGRSLSRRDHYDGGTESGGDEEVDEERMATTWRPPPKHWRFGEQRHDSGKDVGSEIREPGGNEIIGTASQADSGKDVTEMASTPRESRGYFSDGRQRSVSRGRSGRSSASRQNGQQTTAAATAAMGNYTLDRSPALAPAPAVDISRQHHGPDPTLNRNEHEHEHPQGNPPSIFPSDPAPPPTAGLGHSHDDLKGIGSAYGPAELGPLTIDDFDDLNEKRQHEIIIDESLMSSEFDKSLRQAQAQAHA
jgi:serine/threonine protein kinase